MTSARLGCLADAVIILTSPQSKTEQHAPTVDKATAAVRRADIANYRKLAIVAPCRAPERPWGAVGQYARRR